MQFSSKFSALSFTVLAALAVKVAATPAPVPAEAEDASYLISVDQFKHWLATTDSELTFIGEPITPLTPRAALNTIVTYCSHRSQNVCGGPCTVYNGGAACLNAPDTACLSATQNVAFCDRAGCGGSCNQLSSCGTRLDNGFCYTPGTRSIIVPP